MTFRDQIYRFSSWSPLLFLAALAALTYWLNTQIQSPTGWGAKEKPHVADIFLKDFQALTLDENGNVKDRLSASFAEHFIDDDSYVGENLKLIQERPNAPLMTITAKRGRVSGDRKNVDLHDDVVAVRQGCREAGLNCSDEPMTLSTDYLNIKPDERLMTSDRTVTITSPTGVVHSVGIVLDDAKRTIHLESNVRGTFESRPTPNATSKQR